MQKYVRTYQNNTAHSAAKLRPGQRLLCQINFRVSSFVAVGAPRRFVSILISSALAYTDSEMELTRTCCFEINRMLRADSKRVLLSTFCFYFRLARFTSLSPLPQVDNIGKLGYIDRTTPDPRWASKVVDRGKGFFRHPSSIDDFPATSHCFAIIIYLISLINCKLMLIYRAEQSGPDQMLLPCPI